MTGRRPRARSRAPKPEAEGPPEPPEETTVPIELSPELLESMRDESERPTIRLPARPPFAPSEDDGIAIDVDVSAIDADPSAADSRGEDKTVRQRVLIGPDGIPRMLAEEELEEATRRFVPSKVLLGRGKAKSKKKV